MYFITRVLIAASFLSVTASADGGVDCANPVILPDGAQTVAIDTTNDVATTLYSPCYFNALGFDPISEFYEWSPTTSGTWLFAMCPALGGSTGAGYDSALALYEPSCGVNVACNEDGSECTDFSSAMYADVTAGNSYIIQLAGWGGTVGTGLLDISYDGLPPANNSCATAEVLPSGSTTVGYDNTHATSVDPLFPGCGDFYSHPRSLWYEWTVLVNSDIEFSTSAAVGGSLIAIHASCGTTPIACSSESGDASVVLPQQAAGTTYLIMVSGEGNEHAQGALTIDAQFSGNFANYCSVSPNSAGAGAVMSHYGSQSAAANNLVIEVNAAAPEQTGLFIYSSIQADTPFGEGRLCVTSPIVRLGPPLVTWPSGYTARLIDFNALSVGAGSSAYFQFWYRDPDSMDENGDGILSGFNLSDGLQIDLLP